MPWLASLSVWLKINVRQPMDRLTADELMRLMNRHAAALELFARQWTESASDVVQGAFIKLAACRPKPNQVVQWLYRAVRNGAISAVRSDSRRRRHEQARAELAQNWFAPSPGDRLDAIEVTAALSELPAEIREVIVAHVWGGLSFQDIAEVLEISSSTAHRHYQAGLTILREKMGITWTTNDR